MYKLGLAVVTYNQAGYLRRFLERYLLLEHHFSLKKTPEDTPPLFVVNDGSTDETENVLRDKKMRQCEMRKGKIDEGEIGEGEIGEGVLPEHPGAFFYYNAPHQGIAKCRNLALKSFPCEWMAFTDTDCLLSEGYFQALLSIPSTYPEAVAVEGAVCGSNGSRQFAHTMDNRRGGMYATANMVFHVDRTLSLGGFDESFGNYREDVDLGLRIRERAPVPFHKTLVVEHPVVPRKLWRSLKSAPGRINNVVFSEIRLYQKHPRAYSAVRAKTKARETLLAMSFKHAYLECRSFFERGERLSGRKWTTEWTAEWTAFWKTLVCALWEQLWYAVHTVFLGGLRGGMHRGMRRPL